jgi:hypothetical protein
MDSVIEFARQDRVSEALNELLLTAAYQLIEQAMEAELQDYLHAVGIHLRRFTERQMLAVCGNARMRPWRDSDGLGYG